MANVLDTVTVKLLEDVPHGSTTILFRARVQDRRDITEAAKRLGITQSQFMRNTAIQAARQVLAEAVANEPTPI